MAAIFVFNIVLKTNTGYEKTSNQLLIDHATRQKKEGQRKEENEKVPKQNSVSTFRLDANGQLAKTVCKTVYKPNHYELKYVQKTFF